MEERYTITGVEKESCLRFLTPGETPTLLEVDTAIAEIETDMYPFINSPRGRFPSARSLLRTYAGRGIVMTTGDAHARFAINTIRMIHSLGCSLPIQIFYADDRDLTVENQRTLSALPYVELVDVSKLLDIAAAFRGEPLVHLGWAMKPFAMLASRFNEIILLDADILFLQNPEVMFRYQLYRDTGSLLFMDRTLWAGGRLNEYLEELMEGEPLSEYYYTHGRAGRTLSAHEGESGVIVFDKQRNFHVLLLACKMNSGPYQQDMYSVLHGDKESYWMAHEMVGLPYSWAPGAGGALGFLEDHPQHHSIVKVCGQLYHPDPDFRPLWANGGMLTNKRSPKGEKGEGILNFTHWATDKTFVDVDWDMEDDDRPFCLYRLRNREGLDWDALTTKELGIIDTAAEDWKMIMLDASTNFTVKGDKPKLQGLRPQAWGKNPRSDKSSKVKAPDDAFRIPRAFDRNSPTQEV
ncbi:hypothetical protein HKX48_009574 [Thoreauomyces humboldtii]|nr:hypothetical protein HKX48_009574 [Thoreauomyces humboldtii]